MIRQLAYLVPFKALRRTGEQHIYNVYVIKIDGVKQNLTYSVKYVYLLYINFLFLRIMY